MHMLREIANDKCIHALEKAGYYTVEDIRASKLQEIMEKIDPNLAFSIFKFVFALQSQIPPYFQCPISQELLYDPVVTPSGITFERENITAWIEIYKTDPVSGKPLRVEELIPNVALADAITEFYKN